jgi:hypothetical protein
MTNFQIAGECNKKDWSSTFYGVWEKMLPRIIPKL